jgi:hypothetical protein
MLGHLVQTATLPGPWGEVKISFMTLLSLTPGAEIPAVGTSVPLVDHGDHC